MTYFEDRPWLPERTLSAQQVAYFREVLVVHGNDPATGRCRTCQTGSCPDWRGAYDHLAAAGALMAEPEEWLADEHTNGRPR